MNSLSNFEKRSKRNKDQKQEDKQEQYNQPSIHTSPSPSFIKSEHDDAILEPPMNQQIYTQNLQQVPHNQQFSFPTQVDLSKPQPYPQFHFQSQHSSSNVPNEHSPINLQQAQFESNLPYRHKQMPSIDSNNSRSGTPPNMQTLGEEMAIGSSSSSRKRPRKSDHGKPGDEGDNELKQLAFKVSKYPLPDLALQIKTMENDDSIPETRTIPSFENNPSSNKETSKERQRQIFAMVWLLNSCESSPTAVVPRNRIYARYVQICADNSLTPLSPASFGKLVRILFPSLTTRRLGMRGQSKYHYCGIKLVGDQNIQGGSPGPNSLNSESPPSLHTRTPSLSQAKFPAFNDPTLAVPVNSIHITEKFHLHDIKYIPNLFPLVESSLNNEDMNSPLNLPSIYPYLPKDADYDIADTLYSLYKVHCTSIFESLRYMHISKLFSSFTTFNSILTAPVFKLYTSESVTEWVQECDLVMYRTMAKMLTKLHLQSVPDEVVHNLKQVSRQYTNKLQVSLQSKVPKTFMSMKLRTAKHFIAILTRLIKVIETGHSAARILNNSSEKQLMLEDWRKLDIREITLREVPCPQSKLEQLFQVLTIDLPEILEDETTSPPSSKDFSCLHQVARLVASLPEFFKNSNPRLFMLVSSNLLTTFLREISLNGGQSFGAWWIVRCWADEFLYWCFELGGFLKTEFLLDNPRIEIQDDPNTNFEDATADQLRSSSMVDLLDGAYGSDYKDDPHDPNFDIIGLENILGKNENF